MIFYTRRERKLTRKESSKLKNLIIFCAISLLLFSAGCADITLPTPKEIIENPIGPDSVKVGMTKDKVKSLWGAPDQVNYVKDAEKWSGEREEWVYFARLSKLPVGADYLSKTKKVYFDGDHVTNIE